ncbi:UDP-3-O-(3-hydroxymyristoyl)glucosamine N-acyltransferase [Synechococcus sp. Tobar12-5m-g]|uniref:UDP-3-O-(3-hydroxymyristoyl)glucosamine N-acyltransferase n=1 Tax=unclassified Synechococcus TaxID=2626047 RepID=UPI0020CE77F1|nr:MULTISPECIES: UDP-3-O-(3-hydroxymyristoyl)glucosamine N-acyltransferase [unclassified Synechococcus]MCP9772796.1 UDP-3-O-(3-hydroxymyristoyl)glucosamine N-acyltransferase [Synechococcus sp. Tobar12-5m-g]MCP9873567.1 UDP-3-O-(3-hydroxymyristoyl)glucosamine N-acyltransferase [Synechococcus sp. Cruz CV-v-12]
MRFSSLLARISAVEASSPRHLAGDPELSGAEALDRAGAGQLAFLEAGNALAAALSASAAAALLLPLDDDLQRLATDRGVAWVGLKNPRLGFAEALTALHPPRLRLPGIHPSAVVDPGADVAAEVHVGAHGVIGAGCVVARGCTLHPGVVLYEHVQLGEGCEIHANAVLHPGSRLGVGCVVQSNAVIGAEGFGFVPTATGWVKMPQTGRVVLEDGVEVGCGSTIDRPTVGETRIGSGTKIDNLVHVGHGVVTGKGCALAAQVGIAGGAVLGNGVILAGQVGVANRAVIGDRAIASSKSGIHGEIAAGEVVSGYPAIPNRLWLRCSAVFNKLPELSRSVRQLRAGR